MLNVSTVFLGSHVDRSFIEFELVAVPLLVCAVVLLLPLFYNYHFTNTAFQCRLFGLVPFFNLRFDEIKSVSPYRRFGGGNPIDILFRSLALGNRPFRPALRLKKTRGIIRFVIITPPNVDAYVEAFERKGVAIDNPTR